jgi:hypothetical protein
MLFLLIFLIILLFYIIYNIVNIFNYEHYEHYKNCINIIFLNESELFNILNEDDDNYYNTFNNHDFIVRNIKDINDYIINIQQSVYVFNIYQKNKIIKCINNANNFFVNIKYDWLDGTKINSIAWKLGCVIGKLYEQGLPHTRSDIIILQSDSINNSTEENLTRLLIHEKIHIYQKIYKNDINSYLLQNNFKLHKQIESSDNTRANPDINNNIYINNDIIYKSLYIKNPKTILDVTHNNTKNQIYEHPYEKMAIEISNMY